MTGPVLAIVGSTQFAKDKVGTEWATLAIEAALEAVEPVLVISGGAWGIDKLGVRIAKSIGIETREYEPKVQRWLRGSPDGFEARNMLIARACTELLCIRHLTSKTYGSGWTADRAEEMRKPVVRLTWPPPDAARMAGNPKEGGAA